MSNARNPADVIENIMKLAKERALSEPAKMTPKKTAEIIQLPIWPEAVRGVPNGVLRSALFGAIKKGPRRYLEREQIHCNRLPPPHNF
jgi:hypothetical protein